MKEGVSFFCRCRRTYVLKEDVYYRVAIPFIRKPLLAEIPYDWFRSLDQKRVIFELLVRGYRLEST